eukprot:904359_1
MSKKRKRDLVESANVSTCESKKKKLEENTSNAQKVSSSSKLSDDSALPLWMKHGKSLRDVKSCSVKDFNFHSAIHDALSEMDIVKFFPTQARVIPEVLRGRYSGSDICVCAPTGSGKTLAYVLPIVQSLSTRVVTRLRALVIVPTRDLALQVQAVFRRFCIPLGLTVATAIGQTNFAAEQCSLVGETFADRLCLESPPRGGNSLVDVLVATPGRLVDHLMSTKGFSLQHLEFLVIDEADRLLTQSYQDWIPKVYGAAYSDAEGRVTQTSSGVTVVDATCIRKRGKTGPTPVPFQKLLFSATLTRDPQHLAALKLRSPIFFSAATDKLYVVPEGLEERLVVCKDELKPLILAHILLSNKSSQILCFAASVDSTHRLYRFLKLFWRIFCCRIFEFPDTNGTDEDPRKVSCRENQNNCLFGCHDARDGYFGR